MQYHFSAIVGHDVDGYWARCPEPQGRHTQGDTYEEGLNNLRETVALHVEDRLSCGEDIPRVETISLITGKVRRMNPRLPRLTAREVQRVQSARTWREEMNQAPSLRPLPSGPSGELRHHREALPRKMPVDGQDRPDAQPPHENEARTVHESEIPLPRRQ